jgi:hypothetical protein
MASGEAEGNAAFTPGPVTLSPPGIPTAQAFGPAAISLGGVMLAIAGIGSREAFGNPISTPGTTTLLPTGVPEASIFGLSAPIPGIVSVSPVGMPAESGFGFPVLTATTALAPSGIASGQELGPVVVTLGGTGGFRPWWLEGDYNTLVGAGI